MFKLFIVDDEPTIRKGLSQFIPWNNIDVEIVGEACDGASALKKIETLNPDIVITDIKMPNMDGIELSKMLFENYHGIKVIILTGYADFSYAQSAIRYDVTDFVLKPTPKDKIIAAVKGAQERILVERKQEYTLNGDLSILQEQVLEQLTRGLIESYLTEDRLRTYNVTLNYYYLIAFQISEYQAEKKQSNILALKNMISILNKDGYCYFYDNNIVLSIFKTPQNESSLPKTILASCKEISDVVNNFSDTQVSIGVSLCHHGFAELSTAGFEVVQALSKHFFNGEDISFFSPSQKSERTVTTDQSFFLCGLESLFESYDFETINHNIRDFFTQQKIDVANAQDTVNICTQIYLISARVLSKNNRPALDSALNNLILESVSITELEKTVEKMILITEQNLRHTTQKTSEAVTQTREYIDLHYAENLHLSGIAGHVHINSQYLCRIFKKECGETINEYITKIRINRAKELLRNSNYLTYEVGEKVGFNDPAYFSSVFKKLTGISPKDYN